MAHPHHARRATVVALLVTITSAWSVPATAQTRPQNDTLQRTYDAAMKCFVANGHARGLKRDTGDTEAAARYDGGARTSFDAVRTVAYAMGYSSTRMSQDYDAVIARELPLMVNDPDYFRSAVATCRALGLMPTS